MGIFNELGRQVERFKQTAENSAEESTAYQCRACDARFHTHHDQCPECGSEQVESTTTGE